MEEIYKLYENCIYISNLGNMKSLKGEKRIATRNSEGYYIFNVGQKLRNHRLHRAVATLFLKNPDPEHFTDVNHIDGDKSNNRADNLEWCDRSYNLKHAYDTGLHKKKVEEES